MLTRRRNRVRASGQEARDLVLAMVHGQLGNRDAAARALQELLVVYPAFLEHARQEIEKFFYAQRDHAEHVLEGLRKAGLQIPGNLPVLKTAVTSAGGAGLMPARPGDLGSS